MGRKVEQERTPPLRIGGFHPPKVVYYFIWQFFIILTTSIVQVTVAKAMVTEGGKQ